MESKSKKDLCTRTRIDINGCLLSSRSCFRLADWLIRKDRSIDELNTISNVNITVALPLLRVTPVESSGHSPSPHYPSQLAYGFELETELHSMRIL